MQDDKKILNKILFGIEKFKRKDKKITPIILKFSMKEYEKIRHANRLSITAIDLLHLIREFGKLHGIKGERKMFFGYVILLLFQLIYM